MSELVEVVFVFADVTNPKQKKKEEIGCLNCFQEKDGTFYLVQVSKK